MIASYVDEIIVDPETKSGTVVFNAGFAMAVGGRTRPGKAPEATPVRTISKTHTTRTSAGRMKERNSGGRI